MARTQAKILVTIWSSDDWRALTVPAQWLYTTLLSQSRLTLAGSIDLMPSRWATLSTSATPALVEAAINELVARRYIVVDQSTGELVVRTFTVHDLAANRLNRNLAKGFWTAWSGIMSTRLRHVVVTNMPDDAWDKVAETAPPEALRMRQEPRFEPDPPLPFEPHSPPRFEPGNGHLAGRLDETPTSRQFEPETPSPFEPPPPPPPPPPTTAAAATGTGAPVHDHDPNLDVIDRGGGNPDSKLTEAARLLGLAEARRRGPEIGNPDGYAAARTGPLRLAHSDTWRQLLDGDPTLTPDDLVAALHSPSTVEPTTDPDFLPGTGRLDNDREAPPDWDEATPMPTNLRSRHDPVPTEHP